MRKEIKGQKDTEAFVRRPSWTTSDVKSQWQQENRHFLPKESDDGKKYDDIIRINRSARIAKMDGAGDIFDSRDQIGILSCELSTCYIISLPNTRNVVHRPPCTDQRRSGRTRYGHHSRPARKYRPPTRKGTDVDTHKKKIEWKEKKRENVTILRVASISQVSGYLFTFQTTAVRVDDSHSGTSLSEIAIWGNGDGFHPHTHKTFILLSLLKYFFFLQHQRRPVPRDATWIFNVHRQAIK